MSKKVHAILLDTRSIQKYIFSSNKLRTNVGASYLVSEIFEKHMIEVLKESHLTMPAQDWRKVPGVAMETDESIQLEVAYIGGGNMLILVSDDVPNAEEECKNLVYAWSKKLLVVAPGLRTGAAIGTVELGEGFSLDGLYQRLKLNQNTVFPNVDLPYTGLTVECNISGLPANDYMDGHYVAASEKAKERIFQQANDSLRNDLRNRVDLGDYVFTDSLEHLGQKKGDEYIAVVHIDGNNMGQRFSGVRRLSERKALSMRVAECTKNAFASLLDSITGEYGCYYDETLAEGGMLDKWIGAKKILPIRPIIIGGDDITFVCPAKCALIYTKRFMEVLEQTDLPGGKFYSCGGIAIVPTKYPFFRAYNLAEEICGEAKKKARKCGGSWLDFLVLHGEQSGDLARIRHDEFSGELGNMHYGPYCVADLDTVKSVERLIRGALDLRKMPRNKLKGIRDVIGKGNGEIELFMSHLEYSGIQLPDVAGKHKRFVEHLWDENWETPYLDMIEIMDFVFDEGEVMK